MGSSGFPLLLHFWEAVWHSFLASFLPLGLRGVWLRCASVMQNVRAVPWIPALGDNQELECGVALSAILGPGVSFPWDVLWD